LHSETSQRQHDNLFGPYFCGWELEFGDWVAEGELELFVPGEEWLLDPVVSSDPPAFMASKTDIP